jgi:hypothetical protein
VKTGNGVGKSFVASGIVPWFATLHPRSKTVVAAPTQAQLQAVLWDEMRSAIKSAERHGRPLGGKLSGLTWELGENWRVEGFGSGSVESKSGRHSEHLLAVIDEASGVSAAVLEGIESLNPSRRLYTGNPLRPEGKFYELCEHSADNPNVNVIQVSSLDSPHAHLERSPFGMADRTWLDSVRHEYGEESIWWLVHVLGLFPSELYQALLPIAWLAKAAQVLNARRGPTRLGVDLGKGNDGDDTQLVVRDDDGVLHERHSRKWDLEQAAEQCHLVSVEFGIEPQRITYDATAIGVDFGNRLAARGLVGAKDYMGSRAGGEKFNNLRSASAWLLRRRLDPARSKLGEGDEWQKQQPFALPADMLRRFRPQLQGLRYSLDHGGRIALEVKEEFAARLKHSPNFIDALAMTFAYPYA